jgi:hypothetical protein
MARVVLRLDLEVFLRGEPMTHRAGSCWVLFLAATLICSSDAEAWRGLGRRIRDAAAVFKVRRAKRALRKNKANWERDQRLGLHAMLADQDRPAIKDQLEHWDYHLQNFYSRVVGTHAYVAVKRPVGQKSRIVVAFGKAGALADAGKAIDMSWQQHTVLNRDLQGFVQKGFYDPVDAVFTHLLNDVRLLASVAGGPHNVEVFIAGQGKGAAEAAVFARGLLAADSRFKPKSVVRIAPPSTGTAKWIERYDKHLAAVTRNYEMDGGGGRQASPKPRYGQVARKNGVSFLENGDALAVKTNWELAGHFIQGLLGRMKERVTEPAGIDYLERMTREARAAGVEANLPAQDWLLETAGKRLQDPKFQQLFKPGTLTPEMVQRFGKPLQ